MKKLALSNPSYRYLEKSFAEWLDIQGYAKSTVYNLPIHARELLHYLEQQQIAHIKQLDTQHIHQHYQNLKERSNQRQGGGLGNAHLNKHIQALRKFTEYLNHVGRLEIPMPQLNCEEPDHNITWLTEQEIQELFTATRLPAEPKGKMTIPIIEAIQSRDRAMLSVYYGCGLRRNEGVHLDISDINFDRSILHVRKGKNNKERLVPINKASLKHLLEYTYDHRPKFLDGSTTGKRTSEALFISLRAKRMQGQSLLLRLKYLQTHTDKITLKEKEIGLHTLRHSIATHLLSAGMTIENISRFLGHSSLESTQIYTHLIEESTTENLISRTDKQPYNNIPKYEITQPHEDE